MTDAVQRLAWNNKPAPASLGNSEQVQYVMLRTVYRNFRNGTIPEDEAKEIKERIIRCGALVTKARIALLQYVYTFLCAENAGGDAFAKTDMLLIEAQHSLIAAKPPHNPFADK